MYDGLTPADAPSPGLLIKACLIIALYSHDAAGATAALPDIPTDGLAWGENRLPKAWFEALAARLRHDEAAAREAFLRARVDQEHIVTTNPLIMFPRACWP